MGDSLGEVTIVGGGEIPSKKWGSRDPLVERVWEGALGPYRGSSKRPTVGRIDDLPWVLMTTYRRSLFGGTKEGLKMGRGVGRLPSPAYLKEG